MQLDPKNHRLSLDIFRGAAILLVLGRHLPEGNTVLSGPLVHFFRKWYQVGWSGVDLFFILSSFLISGLLFKEYIGTGSLDIKRFLIRRGLRIYPAFYLMIAISAILLWKQTHLKQYLVEIFYLQSYALQSTVWFHTWSLAIEEHFYISICILFTLLLQKRSVNPFGIIPWLWLCSACACLYLRLMIPFDSTRLFTNTHLRIDAFLFGMTLSYFFHFHRASLDKWLRRFQWPLIAIALLCLWPVTQLQLGREPFLTRFGLTTTYLGYGILLALAVIRKPSAARPNIGINLLAALGRRSYSVYLWHAPVVFIIAQPLVRTISRPEGLWLGIFVYLASALTAGELTYRFVEAPILRWRDKKFASKANGSVA